jgi:ribulose-5-phosphate 4-epimerase/fuculose-1-phosphate aldolase
MDPAEWAMRVDLAACYRLVAHYGMDDLIYTHISARVPGADHHFLINPYGFTYREVTASNLLKIDLHGNLVGDAPHQPNQAGFVIHSAIHGAREDAICVLHTHTDANIAVSALDRGLLPLSQFAMRYYNRVGVHDYEGVALDLDEQRRLVADLGAHQILLLRNHGLITLGRTVAEAFILAYYFERAARVQLKVQAAAAAGERIVMPPHEVCEHAARQFIEQAGDIRAAGEREWPAFLRLLDRTDPDYLT